MVLAAVGPISLASASGPDCDRERSDELTCLACNIYHEARNQGEEGQMAVAMVTLNRLLAPEYPKSVCAVVWETGRDRNSGRTVAQFSWVLDGRSHRVQERPAWDRARRIAAEALASLRAGRRPVRDPSGGATFYHATYVDPDWSRDPGLQFVTRIDDHLFYRSRAGATGEPRTMAATRAPSGRSLAGREAVEAAPASAAAWVRSGAKLISLTPMGSGNAIRVRSIQGGRVETSLVGREAP